MEVMVVSVGLEAMVKLWGKTFIYKRLKKIFYFKERSMLF